MAVNQNDWPTDGSAFALIGAGPAGLAMAKNLIEHNIEFEGFELNNDIGGLWDIDAPRSTMYESAHLISSRTMTEFHDFPMNASVAEFPSHREVKQYFDDFVEKYNIRRRYRFNAEVVSIHPVGADGDGWIVRWRDSNSLEHEKKYCGILLANGTLSEPNMPEFTGQFDGELIHASKYRKADTFTGKRVLIIGAGNSGCDIAIDAVHHATSTDLSVRRGYHFVPKYVFGRPADTVGGKIKLPMPVKRLIDGTILKWFVGDPQRYGFPKPDYKLYESHPVVNSLVLFHAGHGDIKVRPDINHFDGHTVHFTDGSQQDYDLIVAATGYRLHYPFINHQELNWKGGLPHMYLNCFHPTRDDVFMLGMVEALGLGWQGRHDQSELVVRYINAVRKNSAAAAAFRQSKAEPFEDARGNMNYIKLSRMAYYVDKDTFLRKVRAHINVFKRKPS